jgi:hypothetical protein
MNTINMAPTSFDPNTGEPTGFASANSLSKAFNPQDKNQYNGSGFMSGNNSGSLFGGGGFAGK